MSHKRQATFLLSLLLPLTILVAGWTAQGSSLHQSAQADPTITGILNTVSESEYRQLVEGLSGARPVTIGGQSVTFVTRYTPSEQGTLAEQYVYEYFQSLGLKTEYHPWDGSVRCAGISGRNVVAEIPGTTDPRRIYVMSAHLDSISPRPLTDARGADDDG